MSANRKTAAAVRERILTLLAVRRGGSTRAEIADILGLDRAATLRALQLLRCRGQVAMHGRRLAEVVRYTLPDDPLTRPVARNTGAKSRPTVYPDRVRIVLAALEGGPKTHATLARLCGASKTERRFGILDTLQRMVAEGLIERVGRSVRTRYRKAAPKRIAA